MSAIAIDGLRGATLDLWVARSEGFSATLLEMYGQAFCRIDVPHHGFEIYAPSENWLVGGPMAERRLYTVYPLCTKGECGWIAEAQCNALWTGTARGSTWLEAACRLRVREAVELGYLKLSNAEARLPDSVYMARGLIACTAEQLAMSDERDCFKRIEAGIPHPGIVE